MRIDSVLKSTKERVVLYRNIDSAIKSSLIFKSGCHARTRKKKIHELIAKKLNQKKVNTYFMRMVGKRMALNGFRPVIIHGKHYFRNVLIKDDLCHKKTI